MSNHFHLVVRNENDGDLPKFMRWLCGTHAKRFHARRGSTGTGAVYQARYRAFPVQTDGHFLRVCRYVERNPVRANLVSRAEHWRWSTSWRGFHKLPCRHSRSVARFCHPPTGSGMLNTAQTLGELAAVRECVKKSRPFGEATCDAGGRRPAQSAAVAALAGATVHPRRPRSGTLESRRLLTPRATRTETRPQPTATGDPSDPGPLESPSWQNDTRRQSWRARGVGK